MFGEVPSLLGHPRRVRMPCCAGQVNAPRPQLDGEQDVESVKPGGLHGEKVNCDDPLGLDPEELTPCRTRPPWGRSEPVAAQDHPDRGRGDRDSELGELSFDPYAPPPRVLPSHPHDEVLNVLGDGRPTAGRSMTVRPLPAHQLAVPSKQRLRADQERRPSLARKHPAERRHEQPIAPAKARTVHLALEYSELMSKDKDLDVVVPGFQRPGHQADQSAQKPVDESAEHGSSLLPSRLDPTNALAVRVIDGLRAPQGWPCPSRWAR